jgi:hypothetical protein
LRGFDMFWIIGGDILLRALAHRADWPVQGLIDEQLEHAEWEGFHFYDLIFPLFLFLVGVVLPFSLGKLQGRGEPRSRIYWRIVRRTVLLFGLGLGGARSAGKASCLSAREGDGRFAAGRPDACHPTRFPA